MFASWLQRMDAHLDPVEVRVLGSLVEKDLSTPDYYPMTVNALTAACNQKSNRDPVVEFTEEDVQRALESLQRRRLAGTATSAYSRTTKYRHALAERFDLDRPRLAVLASLMLRGPETVGELRGRMGRMFEFESLEEVEHVLGSLVERDEPLVGAVPRQPGQKEQRYAHLLAGEPVVEEAVPETLTVSYADEARLQALESEVTSLRADLEALRAELGAFRRQFE